MTALETLRDRSFLRTLVLIAVPIALQNLLSSGINLLDNIMLGAVGEVEISAAATANQLFFIGNVLCVGIANGTNVLTAQYWGKGDGASIRKVLTLSYWAAIGVAAVFWLAATFFPAPILSLFSKDPAVLREAMVYLDVTRWLYLPASISTVALMTLRAVGTVNIAMVTSGVSLLTNGFLNWVLIFGNLGAPALGIKGAAIATLIARLVELAITLAFLARFEGKIRRGIRDLLRPDWAVGRDFRSNVVPVVCNESLWSVGSAATTAIIGNLSTGFLAASGIFTTVNQLTMVAAWGISSAAAVIVGNTIGEGKLALVMPRAKAILILSFGVAAVLGGLLWVGRPAILSLYNITPETYQLAYQILGLGAGILLFQAVETTILMGILRGGGDVKLVLVADTVFMWVISIPLGAFTGFVLGWPLAVVYAVIKSDEVLKTAAGLWRLFRGNWVKDVTR